MIAPQLSSLRLLEKSLLLFFGLLIASLLIIFALTPSIYTSAFSLGPQTERYPLLALLILIAIVLFVSTVMYGVAHHWRWLFWLLLLSFFGSVIQVPVEILQFMHVLPNPYPVWYTAYRALVGLFEIGFAVWMLQTYRKYGVWAQGKKSARASV